MLRLLARAVLFLLPLAVFSAVASADSVPFGLLSLDATGASSGEFDVTNLTGAGALPPDFPITSSLTISITSVVVNFVSGPSVTLDATHFTSDTFGGWLGNDSFNLLTSPILSAVITGTLSPTSGLSGLPAGDTGILPGFSATLTDATGGPLVLGDTVVLDATGTTGGGGGTGVPEPGTMMLLGSGALVASFLRRKRSTNLAAAL